MYIKFSKNILMLCVLLFYSCSEKQDRKEISIEVPHKISSFENNDSNPTYVYQWWVGNQPDISDNTLEPIENKAIFTPDVTGEYDVFLSVRDTNNIEIELKEFYFLAVKKKIKKIPKKIISDQALSELSSNQLDPDTMIANNVIDEKKSKIDTLKKITKVVKNNNQKVVKNKTNKRSIYSGWTIQLSSRSSLELAKRDQSKALENGFDAYIEQSYAKSSKKLWFRVRIGNFSSLENAKKIQKEIERFWSLGTWIDRVKIK